MILFRATSHHQLINAIVIKLSEYKDIEADLILSDMTDFTAILDNIRSIGIFRKVYYTNDKAVAQQFISMDKEKRYKASKAICNLWNFTLDDVTYDDYFYGHDILCNKLYYYYLLTRQKKVNAHPFQEGASSYLTDIFERGDNDSLAHSHYKNKSLLANIKDFYLYLPEQLLYSAPVPVKKINVNFPEIKSVIRTIYNPSPLPKQKFIYIATCSEFQGVVSNEIQIIKFIADCVGKENLIIKGHPRFSGDKFSWLGYSVMDSSVAWEAYGLDDAITDKVMISTISTSVLSTVAMRSDILNCIIVKDIFQCDFSRFNSNERMDKFINGAMKNINDERRCFYNASSFEALKQCLIYLKGRLKSK